MFPALALAAETVPVIATTEPEIRMFREQLERWGWVEEVEEFE